MSQFIYMMMQNSSASEMSCCFAAAASAALYSEICARKMHAPAIIFIIPSIIPLVPGGMLFYTMSALILDEIDTATELAVSTFATAGSIAMGIFMASSVVRLLGRLNFQKYTEVFFSGDGKSRSVKKIR